MIVISGMVVWLLILTVPGPVVIDRLDSRVECEAKASSLFRKKPMHKGKCIRALGTLAPI